MDLRIRPARWSDRRAILALAVAMGRHDDLAEHADPMQQLSAVLRRSEARVLVAESANEVVGYAEIHRRSTTLHAGDEAWLSALAVAPARRGQGIGTALLGAVEDAARELGCVRIDLESALERGRAHGFYRRAGYAERMAAARFRREVEPRPGVALADRFLEAAALAASAVAAALEDLEGAQPVGLGSDGMPTEAVDAAAERAAVAALTPLGLPIVSEEAGLIGAPPPADAFWIALDPLDGSRNFRGGLPPYALAVALVRAGKPQAGFVCELVSGRRWSAIAGKGAHADGRPIHARRSALIGLPSPFPHGQLGVPGGYAGLERIRISGSTATDLCRIADGSLAAFLALDRPVVHAHDLAGPLAIVLESGGAVVDRAGEVPAIVPDPRRTYDVVAAADRELALELLAAARRREVRAGAGPARPGGR
jgi:3'(2'), 5'-bisphosphate nucleotidase